MVTTVARKDAVHAAEANTAWLEDCSARLLCVLALDRFGDYVSDKVCIIGLDTPVIHIHIMPHLISLGIHNLARMTYQRAGRLAPAYIVPLAPLAKKWLAGART